MRNISSSTVKSALAYLIICAIFLPTTALAYVDPGSGSVIVSTVLGLIAAIGYTFRKYFYKLKRSIMGGKHREKHPDDQVGTD